MYKRVPSAEILPRSVETEAYLKWASENGIRLSKTIYPVRFPPGYIGTMASEQINPGDTIVAVPNSALLTSKTAENSEISSLFHEYDDFFDEDDARYEDLVIITYLLWEKAKGESSKWFHFIKNQPQAPEALQDWTVEELQQLQDPELVFDTKQQLGINMKLWANWKKTLLASKVFSHAMVEYNEFSWAFRLLGTRTFGKFVPYTTFAPIAEFLNHHNTNTYYYYGTDEFITESAKRYVNFNIGEDNDDEMISNKPVYQLTCKSLLKLCVNEEISMSSDLYKLVKETEYIDNQEQVDKEYSKPDPEILIERDDKELRIVAGNETYEAGSEVYMSYGRYSNRMLLSTYGFALKDNCYDYARIRVSLDKLCDGEKAYQVKAKNKARLYEFKLKANTLNKGIKNLEFLRTIRALNWEPSLSTDAFYSPASSILELKVFETAEKIINKRISSFPTTLDKDLELLITVLPIRHYFALIYRSEIKKILNKHLHYINAAKSIIQKIQNGARTEEALDQFYSFEASLNSPEETQEALKSYFRAFKIYNE